MSDNEIKVMKFSDIFTTFANHASTTNDIFQTTVECQPNVFLFKYISNYDFSEKGISMYIDEKKF